MTEAEQQELRSVLRDKNLQRQIFELQGRQPKEEVLSEKEFLQRFPVGSLSYLITQAQFAGIHTCQAIVDQAMLRYADLMEIEAIDHGNRYRIVTYA